MTRSQSSTDFSHKFGRDANPFNTLIPFHLPARLMYVHTVFTRKKEKLLAGEGERIEGVGRRWEEEGGEKEEMRTGGETV